MAVFGIRLLAAILCLGLCALSARHLDEDLNVIGTRATAEMLNLRKPVDETLLSSLATGPEAAFVLTQCRSEILADALVIQLNQLDRTNIATDDQGWADAIKRTEALVEHTERCAPGDGDLWLRDAMLIRAVAEEPEAIVKRLALSANLTSSYMPVVMTRVALWAGLGAATQKAGKDLIDDDLRIMVFYFPPYQTAAMIKSLPESLRERAMSFVPLAPAEHKARLETALAHKDNAHRTTLRTVWRISAARTSLAACLRRRPSRSEDPTCSR